MRAAALGLGLAVALVAGFLRLPRPGDAARGAPAAPGLVIAGARVFDGERLSEGPRVVVVRGGRVEAVTEGPPPGGLPVVDGTGCTLLPGLIDAHVHTFGRGLADAAAFGVTTVLDMFTDPAMARELRPSREALAPHPHADLFSAGWLATVPGGHGTEYGLPVPTLSSPEEAPAFVAARLAEGSDWLKLVYEPPEPWKPAPFPSLDLPTLRALVREAHAHGTLAVVHISRRGPAQEALEAGADGLAHAFLDLPVDPALLAAARARGAFVVPTLSVLTAVAGEARGQALAADSRLAPYLSEEQRRTLELTTGAGPDLARGRLARDVVRALHRAGVEVLAGTDAPNGGTAQGVSLHGELELLVESGLGPAEALAAATSVPARRFRLVDRGRVAPGARADLLLVRGDPTADIRATRAIERVFKNGAEVPRRRYTPGSTVSAAP